MGTKAVFSPLVMLANPWMKKGWQAYRLMA